MASSFSTATPTGGKAGRARLPAAGIFSGEERANMMIDKNSARVIERLREAAIEHGEVAVLLEVLCSSFPGFQDGVAEFSGDEQDRAYLLAAMAANAFASLDRDD